MPGRQQYNLPNDLQGSAMIAPMVVHIVQKNILYMLAAAERMHFSALKPDGMENSAFMYHLNALTRDKLIEKHVGAYRLTARGIQYIDKISTATKSPRLQPKVICIFALYHDNDILVAKKLRQPDLGLYMLPSGKQHYGESPEQHIIRELREQLHEDPYVIHRGVADLRIAHQDGTLIHLLAHMYSGVWSGVVPPINEKFSYMRVPVNAVPKSVPGTPEIIKALSSDQDVQYLSLDLSDK